MSFFCAHILRNLLSSEGLGLECPAVGSEDRGLQTGGKKEGADMAEEVILKIEREGRARSSNAIWESQKETQQKRAEVVSLP